MEWKDLSHHTRKTPLSFVMPSVEDVDAMYDAPICAFSGNETESPVVVLATASYRGMEPDVMTAWNKLYARTCWDFGEGNVWATPTRERLPYPYAPLLSLASAFKTEDVTGRRFDWLLWIDDDVVVPSLVLRKLIESAHPDDRPFVATIGFDRTPPFRPAVWEYLTAGACTSKMQWQDPHMGTGLHKVAATGLCCALFHRSFFDRVPQPWFASTPGELGEDRSISYRGNPDSWLCQQCVDADVPIYVDTDIEVAHMGQRIPITFRTVDALRELFGKKS